jgi:hypothetical protein
VTPTNFRKNPWRVNAAVDYHDVPSVAGPVVFDPGLAFTTFVFPAPGADGAGRNTFRAAAYWNLDLSVVKRST